MKYVCTIKQKISLLKQRVKIDCHYNVEYQKELSVAYKFILSLSTALFLNHLKGFNVSLRLNDNIDKIKTDCRNNNYT